jgi:hypothetical protein
MERAKAAEARRKMRLRLAVIGSVIVVAGISIALADGSSGNPASGSTAPPTGARPTGAGPTGARPTGAGPTATGLAALSTLGTLQPAPAPGPTGPEGVPVPGGAPLASTAGSVTGL